MRIIFIEEDGNRREVEAAPGSNLMEAARDAGVSGILGECGGSCVCATCHIYVDPAWTARVPEIGDGERSLLECALHVTPDSRLSCQIRIVPELEGLVLRVPPPQF